MRKFLLLLFLLFVCSSVIVQGQDKQENHRAQMSPTMTEQWKPKPAVVTPGQYEPNAIMSPPSDAIVLFNGTNLSQWKAAPDSEVAIQKGKDLSKFKSTAGEKEANWTVENGVLTVNKEAGDIQTKKTFRDFQLHIEWRIPKGIQGKGQLKGNSGIFLQGLYELQVLDSYDNETYVNGQAASIYKQTPPLVNAMRKPGVWNVYDIIYTAPTFKKDGTYRTYPYVTILHNGVLVQNHTRILGITRFTGVPQVVPIPHNQDLLIGKGPIRLQAHGDKSKPLSYRNIWIRRL